MKHNILLGGVFLFALGLGACVLGSCSHRSANVTLDSQLVQADRDGNTTSVQRLLNKGANIEARDAGGSTGLELAINYGHAETTELLLQKGGSLANAGLLADDAFVDAARNGLVHRVEFLLKRNANLNTENEALFAIAETAPAIVTVAIAGAVPRPPQNTLATILEDPAGTAKVLIENGADIEARDTEGATPLIRAAGAGNTPVVRVLLDKGAGVEPKNRNSATALMLAACECTSIDMPATLDSMKLLLERKANVNAKDKQGETALMWAADAGQTDNVRLLLDSGARIDTTDNHGNTALLLAASAGKYNSVGLVETVETVKLLIARGANAEVRNRKGESALLLATRSHRNDVASILRNSEH